MSRKSKSSVKPQVSPKNEKPERGKSHQRMRPTGPRAFSSSLTRKQSEDTLRLQFERLRILYQMTAILNQTFAVEEVYEAALDSLQRALAADRAAILLFDSDGVVRFKAWRGLSEAYRKAVEGHSPWPSDAHDPQPVLVPDAQKEPTLASFRRVFSDEGIGAMGFIPLTHQSRLLGKFMIYYKTPHAFSAEEIQLAQTIAHHVAFAIARARTEVALRQQTELYESLLRAQSDVEEGFLVADGPRLTYANEAFCRMSGYTSDELLALPSFMELVVVEERAVVSERLSQRLSGQPRLLHYETAILHFTTVHFSVELFRQLKRHRNALAFIQQMIQQAQS